METQKFDKLVSIVIPTWQRSEELFETLLHIQKQLYKTIEIIVVSDGIDVKTELNVLLFMEMHPNFALQYVELGRNWSGLDPTSFGIAPLTVGYLMARGEYCMPWCDDERALTSRHIEKLVELIETVVDYDMNMNPVYPDFVYPRVEIWRKGDPDGPETKVIGTFPPRYCEITHYLFRTANLHKFGYLEWHKDPIDWNLVAKWMRNKAFFAMLNEVTFQHRLDR